MLKKLLTPILVFFALGLTGCEPYGSYYPSPYAAASYPVATRTIVINTVVPAPPTENVKIYYVDPRVTFDGPGYYFYGGHYYFYYASGRYYGPWYHGYWRYHGWYHWHHDYYHHYYSHHWHRWSRY